MANKTTTTIKSKKGKDYNYCRISPMVEIYDEASGEFKRVKKQFCGKNQKEALDKIAAHEKYIEELKIELSKSTKEKLSEKSFGESVKSYIDNTFLPDSSIKESTKRRYINSYHNIFDDQSILSKPVKDVVGDDIQEVITQSKNAPSSKEAALKLIRNYYKNASSQLIAHDVTKGIVIPQAQQKRQDQSIVVYTGDEIDAFLERTPTDHRLRFLIVLAIETGCRIGELLALTYSDFDFEKEQITINKTLSEIATLNKKNYTDKSKGLRITDTKSIDSIRSMPITPLIRKEFSIYRGWHQKEQFQLGKGNSYVFTNKHGELYYPSCLRVALKRLCDKINREYNKANKNRPEDDDVMLIEHKGWHAFRHTYGSDMAAAGVPIQEVCKMMGHSDISVTSKYYIHVSSDQKRQAANMLEEYRRSRRA